MSTWRVYAVHLALAVQGFALPAILLAQRPTPTTEHIPQGWFVRGGACGIFLGERGRRFFRRVTPKSSGPVKRQRAG